MHWVKMEHQRGIKAVILYITLCIAVQIQDLVQPIESSAKTMIILLSPEMYIAVSPVSLLWLRSKIFLAVVELVAVILPLVIGALLEWMTFQVWLMDCKISAAGFSDSDEGETPMSRTVGVVVCV